MVTRDSPSEEYKESLGSTLGDLRKQWLDGTVAARKNEGIRDLLELGPYSPQDAKAKALVEAVGYVDEARDQARRRAKAGHVEPIFGGKKRDGKGGLADVVRLLSGGSRGGRRGGPPYIALVQASGAIDMEKGGSPLSSKDSGIYAKTLIKSLRQLAKDDAAKVVVMRIDSPGGSALASDLLWHEMMLVRKKKPLVISIGDMAASGGYYMACSGTKIIAEETSIIGSIGVVGGKFGLAPALKPLGINVETIPAAGAPAETHATYMSLLTPWDDSTRDSVRRSMTAIYDLFLQRVSEGRGMPVEKVQTFAEGHIFSGREAKARGMIDELGGYERAIEFARAEAKLDNDAPVRVIADQPGLLELLEGSSSDLDPTAEAKRAATPSVDEVWPSVIAPEWRVFAASYAPLLRGERALAVLPTVLTIR
jgi:protease IV